MSNKQIEKMNEAVKTFSHYRDSSINQAENKNESIKKLKQEIELLKDAIKKKVVQE